MPKTDKTNAAGDSSKMELKVYPISDGEFIGSIDIGRDCCSVKSDIETIIILDRSGSMGDSVRMITNEILPLFFNKLSYKKSQVVHLITFESETEVFHIKVEEFAALPLKNEGGTYMADVMDELKILFDSFQSGEHVRILTISDGQIFDGDKVKEAGAELAAFLACSNFRINSQAVRLFTSASQPDTDALCSVLRFNNTAPSKLTDIDCGSVYIAKQMAELFESDGLITRSTLTAVSSIFLKFPWDANPTNSMTLLPGKNLFWLKELPFEGIKVDDELVKIAVEPKLTLAEFHKLLDAKLDFIMDHMRILKIVGTDESAETVKRIVDYFDRKESFCQEGSDESADERQLNHRIRKMILSRKKTITNLLASIANDDTVSELNSAQKAEYLRTVDASKNSRGLARRAAKEGLDFDDIARKEVLEMAKHFDEIKDIDDSNHLISFYSRETTLGGIRSLVELTQNEAFESFEATEMLEILNCVGVACSGPIGDYPDPMTWWINEMFLGVHVSMSDLLVAFKQSNGSNLKAPALDKDITNVVPIFDDPKIGIFLRKHAPSLLEYTFSVGMRRMIADVPMTIGYTLCAGVWKMICELDKNKSTLHLEIFQKLVTTFGRFVGKYFDHIKPHLKEQKCGKFQFYLGNNGINNLLSPLIRLHQENDPAKLKIIPDVLRALFSFEAWQGIRREYKNKEDAEAIAQKMLYKLLGIDLEKHKTQLKPIFEDEPDVEFHDEPRVDFEYVKELFKPLFYLKYLALVPKFIQAAINGPLESITEVPTVRHEFILESLQIDYNYQKFLFFNAFQALFYTTRASREDSDEEIMKIIDLKDQNEAMKDVKDYIRSQFEAQYLSELAAKRKEENSKMGDFVAGKIIEAATYEEMLAVWRNGIDRNSATYKIASPPNPGFKVLLQKLCDANAVVPQRLNIFKVLLLGVDEDGAEVWNHGGVCFLHHMLRIKSAFVDFFGATAWDELMKEFKERGKHIYRKTGNRKKHGNGNPSFWAMGFASIDEFRDVVSKEKFVEYCKNHIKCCGVRDLDQTFLKSIEFPQLSKVRVWNPAKPKIQRRGRRAMRRRH